MSDNPQFEANIKMKARNKKTGKTEKCYGFDLRNGHVYLKCEDESHPYCVRSEYLSQWEIIFEAIPIKEGQLILISKEQS